MKKDYNIGDAFAEIEKELIASMIRNMDRHRAEETKEGIQWSMWQVEQLKALERYKLETGKKNRKKFKSIHSDVVAMLRTANAEGGMEQEESILEAIGNGFKDYKRASNTMQAEFFRLNDRKLESLITATTNDMKRAETAVLRMANDKYRKIIFNAQVYANSGAGTYEKAVDMATKDMLAAGLNCIEYKNGARHTLADYADMAIRTASKRAYLQGEGVKRQEWGISTVIMNKRGNPCPKCLPFVGKVFIDDVWSGGKQSDGKYPLMSKAIGEGLYHPRCKDSHTTFFADISTPPDDTWTKDELKEVEEQNKTDAKQQYAKRQASKYGRLSEYSLDDENKKKYKDRERAWREQSKKGRVPETEMNRKAVESNAYKKRVESLLENVKVSQNIWKEMVAAIRHRSGSEFEDLVFIDSVTGKVSRSINFEKVRTARPTKVMKRVLSQTKENTIIAIHNHPGSSVPSWNDIMVASERKYKYGLIACHDGRIFKYKIKGNTIEVFYSSAVAKLDKEGYNSDSLKRFCESVKVAGVEMEVL